MKRVTLSGIEFVATFEVFKSSNEHDDPFDSVLLARVEGFYTRWIDVTDLIDGVYYRDRVVGAKGFETRYLSIVDELQKRYYED